MIESLALLKMYKNDNHMRRFQTAFLMKMMKMMVLLNIMQVMKVKTTKFFLSV